MQVESRGSEKLALIRMAHETDGVSYLQSRHGWKARARLLLPKSVPSLSRDRSFALTYPLPMLGRPLKFASQAPALGLLTHHNI